ncbi:MAG: signal recognition particle-docking protein FtsY [Bacteroidota bacterium]
MFDKLTNGLARTREALVSKLQRLVLAKRTIDDDVLEQVEEALLAGDVGVQTTNALVENIKRRVRDEPFTTTSELLTLMKNEVGLMLRVDESGEEGWSIPAGQRPFVFLIVGINGAGKTTTVGKLAHEFRQKGFKVLIGAADTFRAAANEQLAVWAERAGVAIVQQRQGADPGSVAFDAVSSAVAQQSDVVLIDTAGRLHTKTNLMEELRKVRRVIGKRLPGAPHEVLLVLDAGGGQNGLQQVREFSEASGVTGLILTKLDGTAKGGIVLAACHEFKLPVRYIGVGEGIDDLQPFRQTAFVDALFSFPSLSEKLES